jgi:DNA replication protein DnaC
VKVPDELLARVPEHLRGVAPGEVESWPVRETSEERAERLAVAQATRERVWSARVPARYQGARLGALTRDQHPAELQRWLDNGTQNLVLWSPGSSTGKTFAAYALGFEAVARGRTALTWTAVGFLAALRPGGAPEGEDPMGSATGCDLLVLDDLGREKSADSAWAHEQFHALLDRRGGERLRTVVTTNLTAAEMVARYDNQLLARIVDDVKIIEFTGESMRSPAPW